MRVCSSADVYAIVRSPKRHEPAKRTAGTFLDTLSALAYKETKKNGEFVPPGFGKLVKQTLFS